MDFEKEEERRRRELRKAEEEAAKAAAKLSEIRKKAKAARARLIAGTSRHETWHAYRISAQDRAAGCTGEMSDARHYLRSLPPQAYIHAIAPFADAATERAIVDIEVAAIRSNLDEWTINGKSVLYEKARAAYEAECRDFDQWVAEHPDENGWQEKPATRAQWMLVRRTADALDLLDVPRKLTRGEAHHWLQEHGANRRFRPDNPAAGAN